MKAAVVAADPFETTGVRAALNLGHTAGHALETASGHRLQHGEAVAWGLLAALRLSVARAGLEPAAADALAARVLALARPPRPRPAEVRGGPAPRRGQEGGPARARGRPARAAGLRPPGPGRRVRGGRGLGEALARYN